MCLSIPAKIKSIDGNMAIVSVSNNDIEESIQLIEDPKVGDYVLIHSGIAIEKISDEEANYNLQILKELDEMKDNLEI